MAIVRAFKGVRPIKSLANKVMAKPYDVMNREEAKKMAGDNPFSFLHISRAEIDLPDEVSAYDEKVYLKAKDNLEKFIQEGTLIQDDKPLIYIYKQNMNGRTQRGIVACVSIDDYEKNVIKKHELTRVDKEVDRINHFDICDANTEPVFFTYRDNDQIRTLVEGYEKNNEAEYDILDEDGVRHQLIPVTDDNVILGICGLFANVPSLYIADGHHRTASAYKVGKKRREANPQFKENEEFNFFMAVIFPDSELEVMAYNRVIKDLNGYSITEFLEKVQEVGFDVSPSDSAIEPKEKASFGMYLDGRWYELKARKEIQGDDIVSKLDVSILQNNLISKVLGIDDPRTDSRIDFVGGIKGTDELERRANSDMCLAFSLYPVSVSEIMNISDNNLIMPPKSTWFEPKLASGLFIHKL